MSNRGGFTIIEVVVAIVILSIGILGLAGTAATVTRMVGTSQRYGTAATIAAQRFEILRATALARGANTCANVTAGSSTSGNYSLAWTVTNVTNGLQVSITVTSPTNKGTRTDTFTQMLTCTK